MEALAPPYRCALQVRMAIEAGDSLRSALREYIKGDNSSFAIALATWFLQGAETDKIKNFSELKKNPYRVSLVRLLGSGLEGVSIYESLLVQEEELRLQSERELEATLRMQPLRMMVPLLLLMFPAFLLLLFGPVLGHLLSMLSQS